MSLSQNLTAENWALLSPLPLAAPAMWWSSDALAVTSAGAKPGGEQVSETSSPAREPVIEPWIPVLLLLAVHANAPLKAAPACWSDIVPTQTSLALASETFQFPASCIGPHPVTSRAAMAIIRIDQSRQPPNCLATEQGFT